MKKGHHIIIDNLVVFYLAAIWLVTKLMTLLLRYELIGRVTHAHVTVSSTIYWRFSISFTIIYFFIRVTLLTGWLGRLSRSLLLAVQDQTRSIFSGLSAMMTPLWCWMEVRDFCGWSRWVWHAPLAVTLIQWRTCGTSGPLLLAPWCPPLRLAQVSSARQRKIERLVTYCIWNQKLFVGLEWASLFFRFQTNLI
jgi:hypothetical protein